MSLKHMKNGSKFHLWDQIVVLDEDNQFKYFKLNEQQRLLNPIKSAKRKNVCSKNNKLNPEKGEKAKMKLNKVECQAQNTKLPFEFTSNIIFSTQDEKINNKTETAVDMINRFLENDDVDDLFFDEDFEK